MSVLGCHDNTDFCTSVLNSVNSRDFFADSGVATGESLNKNVTGEESIDKFLFNLGELLLPFLKIILSLLLNDEMLLDEVCVLK